MHNPSIQLRRNINSNPHDSGGFQALLLKLGTGIIGLSLWLAVPASADTVSGHVYNMENKPAANMTLTAKPTKGETVEFKTNAAGVFSVYLDPGRYTVAVSTDASIQGTVESFPQPVQQDIHLKKGAK